MRYATAEAFRAALDQRLKDHAASTGLPLVRLRKAIAFDRFLARLIEVAPGRWVLKGAVALDYRLGGLTRTTKDIDLGRLDDENAATEDFLAAQALDLGDYFTFTVQRASARDEADDFPAVRYRVSAELAGRRFEEFPIDVAFSDPLPWHPDRLPGTDLLEFAEVERIELPVLPIEQHVAEKLHAYTRAYGRAAGSSTRPKDLIDIVLVERSSQLDAAALRTALAATFAERALQALPSEVPAPPAEWRVPYAKLAETVGLSPDLVAGHAKAASLLNPVLAGHARGRWDPRVGTWDAGSAPPAAPALIPPGDDQIVVGELQNVASEIQPIRVRTIYLTLVNSGEGHATIGHAEASSSGHGPMTARAPRTIAPGESATLELTLAAPVDQTVAPGDRLEVDLRYHGEDEKERRLGFSALFQGTGGWTVARG